MRTFIAEYAGACVKSIVEGRGGFDLANGAVGASLLVRELEVGGLAAGMPTASEMLRIAERRVRAGPTAWGPTAGGLWQGLSGVAWARASLGEDGARSAPQEALVAWVGRQQRFDLIDGVVGAGVVGLAIGESGDALLEAVLTQLAELGEATPEGLAWRARDARPTTQGFDLGMAHGAAGVVAFLAAASHRFDAARVLLAPAAAWLAAQARPAPSPWAFPHFSGSDAASRLAWCYGDPGVAMAIALAARALASDELAALARDVAVRAARRLGDRTVKDAGLCHGAGGLAHLFGRLWQYTGEDVCADASRFWILQTLRWRRGDDAGLLTGGVGACLALLGAIHTREPTWDRSMLLSV